MKRILLLIVLLSTLTIGGCALSTDEYGQAKFLGVDVVDLLPKDAKQQQDVSLPANSNVMTMSLRTSFNESSNITPLNNLNVLSIEYDGFFSLIIDIENPNKDSIHEIRVKNNVSGISHTYQPSQKEDLDGDGIDNDLFYVNGDISTIFLGIKLPKDHKPGDVVSYSVESITYFESGVVKFVQMDH